MFNGHSVRVSHFGLFEFVGSTGPIIIVFQRKHDLDKSVLQTDRQFSGRDTFAIPEENRNDTNVMGFCGGSKSINVTVWQISTIFSRLLCFRWLSDKDEGKGKTKTQTSIVVLFMQRVNDVILFFNRVI